MPTPDTDTVPVPAPAFEPTPMGEVQRRHAMPVEWWDAVGIYLVWVLLSGALSLLIVGAIPGEQDALAGQVVVSLALLLVTIAGWLHLRGGAMGTPDLIRRTIGVKAIAGRDVLLGIGYGVAAFMGLQLGLGLVLTTLIEASGQEVPQVQEAVQRAVQGTGTPTIAIAFGIAVLAPIGEEWLFRGVLYQALAKHLPGWPAIGLSGLAFGLTHLEPLVIVLTFPLGMALAWMLRRHGTLVVPVVAHAVFNVIGVLAIRAAGPVG